MTEHITQMASSNKVLEMIRSFDPHCLTWGQWCQREINWDQYITRTPNSSFSISSHSTGWSKLKTSSQKQTNLGNSSQGKDRKAGLTQLTLVCHSCVDPTNERVS
ncbi:hypothetical protein RRG08_053500 [Elysia crispata]|uniref:Uncharacterized protein n=1 Tax=Elysia crispata TaxID=231223 RepID=A0AAE1DV76_9GAST|nr:hypothetical protein RRG08_053500 [Elysia crispata]